MRGSQAVCFAGSGLAELYAADNRKATRGTGLDKLGNVGVDQDIEVAPVQDRVEVRERSAATFTIGELRIHVSKGTPMKSLT